MKARIEVETIFIVLMFIHFNTIVNKKSSQNMQVSLILERENENIQ